MPVTNLRCLLGAALVVLPAAALSAQINSPGGPVPVANLQARRAAVLKAMNPGVAMIASSVVRSTGTDFPQDADYREHPDFFYLTGIESPGGRLLLIKSDSGSAGEVRLFLPAPPAVADAWSAARVYADTMAARVAGIPLKQICAIPAGGGRGGRGGVAAPAAVPNGQCEPVASLPAPAAFAGAAAGVAVMPAAGGAGRGGAAVVASPVDAVADSLAAQLHLPRLSRGQLSQAFAGARGIKDADEIRRLRRASEISAEAHRAAMLNTRPGMWEYEIEAVVEYTFRRRGAERVGYPSIVGTGPNSTILHYDISRRQSKDGDLVLIDAAAEFGYYTADLTRTFPVNGKFSPRQKALYELVLGAQQAAIDSVKPGVTMARIQQIARAYLKDNSGTLCGDRTCDTYLNHGVSHSVGLVVHDLGSFATMPPGFAFTIEPGLYIPAEGIGIRIEDVILVTPTGHEVLTKDAPRTVAEIEALMKSGKSKGVEAIRP